MTPADQLRALAVQHRRFVVSGASTDDIIKQLFAWADQLDQIAGAMKPSPHPGPIWAQPCDSNPAFFQTLNGWHRHEREDGSDMIELQFVEGGRVNIFTEDGLLWIEPERH